ncbi:DUF1648 domain-containing protein [Nocardiopsis mangrovi]|uniref:DUF1648 domain-containing protein n=1 Tax=Nocardiopsis mangrovi TaxID=1179818 RepID=A0ABV9DSS7_9ACTN
MNTVPAVNAALTLGILACLSAVFYVAPSRLLNPRAVPFGVRVPPDKADAPEVTAERTRYRRHLLASAALVAVPTASLTAVLDGPAVGATGGGLLLCAVTAVLWTRAHNGIADAKKRGGWYEQARQGAVTDTSLRTDPVRMPWPWAIPSLAIIGVTATVGAIVYPGLPAEIALPQRSPGGTVYRVYPTTIWSAFSLVFAQVIVTATMIGVIAGALRTRADLDVARPKTSAARYRRYLVIMARALLGISALVNLMMLGLSGLIWSDDRSQELVLLVAGVPSLLILAIVAYLVLRVGPSGSRLPAGTAEADSGLVPRDDDRFWHLAGTVYVNADDPAALVPRRVGIGWTANLGNLRVVAATTVVVAVAMGVSVLISM